MSILQQFSQINLRVLSNIIVEQFLEIKSSIENYDSIGNKITNVLVHAKYTKMQLNRLVLMLVTIIIRNMINGLVCILVLTGYRVFDFFVQAIISILFILKTNWFYYNVQKYENEFLTITEYFVDNYNFENFRRWKKNLVATLCTIFIVYLFVFPMSSAILIEWILQFLVCYLVIDNIENKNGILYDFVDMVMILLGKRIKSGQVTISERINIIDTYAQEIANAKSESTIVENTHTTIVESAPRHRKKNKHVNINLPIIYDEEEFTHVENNISSSKSIQDFEVVGKKK